METDVISVRNPIIADLEDIIHLNRISLPENYAVAYFIELIKTWNESSAVALVNDKVVGYTIVRIEKSGITPWRSRSKSKAHVISIAVSPDQRRHGIGNKMMEFVIDNIGEINGIKKISLEVRITNHAAIEMYKKLDFNINKILTRYYSDGEDAYLMELLF